MARIVTPTLERLVRGLVRQQQRSTSTTVLAPPMRDVTHMRPPHVQEEVEEVEERSQLNVQERLVPEKVGQQPSTVSSPVVIPPTNQVNLIILVYLYDIYLNVSL